MEDIRKLETKKMIKQIRKENDNPFSTFLVIELKDRFEKRIAEEKHLNFEQWIKIYTLRDKNEEERTEKKWKAFLKQEEEKRKRMRGPLIRKKDKEKYKEVEIPDFIKQLGTKSLLSLRFRSGHFYDHSYSDEMIYAELANRPHIPNKREGKKLRREAAKRKK